MRKNALVLFSLALLSTQAYGQKLNVTGTVVDDMKEPLVGVSVKTADGQGTITDIDGNFTLQVNKGDVLEFSYVGFKNENNYDGPKR